MPYKKKYKKKTKWQRYKNCGSMVAQDAKRALSVAYKVKNLLNVEFKRVYLSSTSVAVPNTGQISPLSNLAQGDGNNTRDGGSVKWMQWDIKFILKQHASAVSTNVRVMVVFDNQTNQTLYSLPNLLTDANAIHNLISNKNMDNPKRFLILYDKLFRMSNSGNKTVSGRYFGRYKKGFKVRYDANMGDITDLTQGSFSIVYISDEPTNTPTISTSIVGRFIDN